LIGLVICGSIFHSGLVFAQRFGRIGPDGSVGLPFAQMDSAGNQWIIYPGGWIRQGGPQPVFAQAETLVVNGNGAALGSNMARMDGKTGELVIQGMNGGGCIVTRRIFFGSPDGLVRFIDIVKNPQEQDQSFNIQLQSNINFGVTSSMLVADPKHRDNQIGWVAMTGANRAAIEIFAGKDSKNVPTISYEQGNTVVQTSYQVDVHAGKSVAIMHLLGSAASIDQGAQTVLALKSNELLDSLPATLRRQIVNFPASSEMAGDYQILRGDAFDVIELRSGDQLQGTLKEDAYKLDTFYGELTLPTDQVIGLMNVGQYRPRQLVVTSDGQIFGGTLESQTIGMELSSGQVVQVPLTQISRVGYRKRPGEAEEWTFDKPYVIMRSGDRVNVELPDGPIDVVTRYGLLKLDPQSIGSILFQSDDTPVHQIFMTDGSKFAGLVDANEFDMKLASSFATQGVKFPVSSLVSLQLGAKIADPDETTPSLSLTNQDMLIGTLAGSMKLDTLFDTIEINGPEIRKITHPTAGSPDVQVTLWDNTTVSGMLEEQQVQCNLLCGAQINVPVSMLAEYNQPLPQPSASMVDKIKAIAVDLSADDWKQRDEAEASLESLGSPVIGVLKDLRPNEPPEAQERIDAIIKQLSGSDSGNKPPSDPGGG
jgi:hypothetical protein